MTLTLSLCLLIGVLLNVFSLDLFAVRMNYSPFLKILLNELLIFSEVLQLLIQQRLIFGCSDFWETSFDFQLPSLGFFLFL